MNVYEVTYEVFDGKMDCSSKFVTYVKANNVLDAMFQFFQGYQGSSRAQISKVELVVE